MSKYNPKENYGEINKIVPPARTSQRTEHKLHEFFDVNEWADILQTIDDEDDL